MKAKKITALLLAASVLAMSLTGCGKPASGEESASQGGNAQGGTEASQKEEGSQGQGTEEPVKLKIMLHNVSDVPEGSVADQWASQLEEKLNLELEWVIPPASAYEDNLQLTLINDDKPDVICFTTGWLSQTSFKDACESGMLLDISDMIENYPNLMAHTNQISWDALDIFNDGRVWGFPRSTFGRTGWRI